MTGEVIALGARLRNRREELGLSQAQAARELDVARTAYRLWELEAAQPAPDRWRTIAKWLGMSVTAMLLAGELLSQQEADDAEASGPRVGMTSASWDATSDDSPGDFFSQERAMIGDQARLGAISGVQAANLRGALARIQELTAPEHGAWHPGEFTKRMPSSPLAPQIARGALAATAVGIPVDAYEKAALLTSELVTNSVVHARSPWIDVSIVLDPERLRIDVSDAGTDAIRPRTPGDDGGWGLTLVAELATRWGVERRRDGKTVWVEFDLSTPV